MADAGFEDGAHGALALGAVSADDLAVIAALTQDSVLKAADIRYEPKARRLVLLLNRFRWEEPVRPPERVRALLILRDVASVAARGFDKSAVLSLLGLRWEGPSDADAGALYLTFSGGETSAPEIRVSAECLNLDLRDVTRPYTAPSGLTPDHGAE